MISGRLIEAFSPGVEKAIFACQFQSIGEFCMQKGVSHTNFFRLEKPAQQFFNPWAASNFVNLP